MTNLTFAELTALIGVNGLIVNDRYFITDKNWTIIAITTNAYRVVVPIVTEVTKLQLDALVAANGLNEGLQYKVTDKNWLLTALTDATLKASSGTLKIANEIIPSYIYSDIFLLDTGVLTADIELGMDLIIPNDTIPICCWGTFGVDLAYVSISDPDGDSDVFFRSTILTGEKYYIGMFSFQNNAASISVYTSVKLYSGNWKLSAVGNTAPGFRLIVKCESSLL